MQEKKRKKLYHPASLNKHRSHPGVKLLLKFAFLLKKKNVFFIFL